MNMMSSPTLAPALPVSLLARIGESLAASAAAMLRDGGDVERPLAQLEEMGLQLQEAARVLAAPAGARPESVGLGMAALQAGSEWARAFAGEGVGWSGPQQDCRVQVNPAVLKQLIDLAFGHALPLARRIDVDVGLRSAPPQAELRIGVQRRDGELFAARPGEAGEWHWALLSLLARHAGIAAGREVMATRLVLTLGFEPVGALAPAPIGDREMLPTSPVPPGCRVLLVEPHEATRVLAAQLMGGAGLQVTTASTIDQARERVAHGLPECLVSGIAFADPACAGFVDDLRARQPGLRLLELTSQPHVFATSLPEAGTPARVARDDIARYLVTAVAQELTAPR